VTSRLEHEPAPETIEPLAGKPPLLEDRRARYRIKAAGDDAERLACGV
jgi:hypothetical protein